VGSGKESLFNLGSNAGDTRLSVGTDKNPNASPKAADVFCVFSGSTLREYSDENG
jgi:hypothetical protein